MNKEYKTINELINETKDVLSIYWRGYNHWKEQSNYSMMGDYDTKITIITDQLQMLNDIKDMIKHKILFDANFEEVSCTNRGYYVMTERFINEIIGDEL